MSDPKAKGKARDTSEDNVNSSQTPSLLSRVAASANSLAGSVLRPPNSAELHDTAEAGVATSGKGRSSGTRSNDPSTLAESSRSAQTSIDNVSHGVRGGHHQEHIGLSEQEFSAFLDGTDSLLSTESVNNVSSLDGIDPSTRFSPFTPLESQTKTSPRQPLRGKNISQPSNRSVVEQEAQDGADVLAILSKPSHDDFELPEETQELFNWGLSPEQVAHVRTITKDLLPPPPQHLGISPHDSLNLAPEFDTGSWESRQHQREQWEGVLTSYTDEVWGGLLPLVRQARVEIKEITEEKSNIELPSALRRLHAILGHLRKN